MSVNLTNNKAIDTYYAAIATYQAQDVTHEQATRLAFSTLLDTLSKTVGWTLVLEQTLHNRKRPDGTLLDSFKIPRGYWEAKDTHDDLDVEIKSKIAKGYPLTNIIFEDTQRAVLYQNSRPVFEADLRERSQLVALLNQFFSYTGEQIEEFHAAVREFQERIPELARGLMERIEEERERNKKFVAAFEDFQQICRSSIDPDISVEEIEEMLVQHLLTERLFRTVFNDPDFTQRNVIAAEIEKVIRALTSRSFNRNAFLKSLDYFYIAIEHAAQTIDDFSQKQTFLNTVYERFFQGFSKDQADTHGIVYTPQPIVDFMVASVDEVLQKEFGLSLSSEGVKILDPCTGTGNFIVNILRTMNRRDLKRKYREELFANEIMLLPYYIASLNIEHAYYDLTGEYEPFDGICFADTLDLAESQQLSFFAEENTERVRRQKDAEITVIIGNPPYNVGQKNENDNNKNRRYQEIDRRIRETYVKDSTASLRTQVYDAYIRFFRWATDRLRGRDGVVCFVSNNGFLDGIAFDGFRKHLAQDFSRIYHFDFKGNARTSGERRRDEGGNVFSDQIRVGVGITLLVRNSEQHKTEILYHVVGDRWTAKRKQEYLRSFNSMSDVNWRLLTIDARNNWISGNDNADPSNFLPLGNKETKAGSSSGVSAIFKTYSGGVKTNRDDWTYDFNPNFLEDKVRRFIDSYNSEVDRWKRRTDQRSSVDEFVKYDDRSIKWSEGLKQNLKRGTYAAFELRKRTESVYRPFCKMYLFFDRVINDRVLLIPRIFPSADSMVDNVAICVSAVGSNKSFHTLITNQIPDFHLTGDTQVFPLYTYDEDGGNRRENITEWALRQFQEQYGPEVTKWHIFHYIYGLLHSQQYRERYAENLKRELPRIPLVSPMAFWRFEQTGARLAHLHLNYEREKEYPLQWIENRDVPFSWHVTKMQLSKDKTQIRVNESLTLAGIPAECFEYRLGHYSALEWVIDQYQVSTDKRTGITSDPNREDDEEYIVRLIGRVITVSVETAKLVEALPPIIEEVVGEPPVIDVQ